MSEPGLIEAVQKVSATSAKYAPEDGDLYETVMRHIVAQRELAELLEGTFNADELHRLLSVLVEMHRDPLRMAHDPESLEEFLMFSEPGGC